MRNRTIAGLTLAGALLAGCGQNESGLGGNIEACTPEVQTSTEISDENLGKLVSFAQDISTSKSIIDGTNDKSSFWNGNDYANRPGELACRIEDNSLVYTASGLAVQAVMNSSVDR